MKISPQKKVRNQAYLEFSRKKFSEFKTKHPLKSDQEIESMVKKQWKSTNRKTYTRGQKSSNSAEDGAQGPSSSSEDDQEEKEDPVKKKLEYEEGQAKKKLAKQQSLKKKSLPKRSAKKPRIKKEKAISKHPRVNEYIKFFKFYYQKLQKEHSNWTSNQITKIIKLLWRKKTTTKGKTTNTTPSSTSASNLIPIHTRALKRLSGRKLFGDTKRKLFKMDAQNIQAMWRVLPRQTRKHWDMQGAKRGGFTTPAKSQATTLRNSPSQKKRLEFQTIPIETNPFSFMNTFM